MNALIRIKRLVIARRVEFTLKSELERIRDGLRVRSAGRATRRCSMSSSRRSSRNSAASGPCPTCGGGRVRQVIEPVVLTIAGVTFRLERVPHERCDDCGERVFGLEASKRLDELLTRKRRSRRVA